MPGVDLVGTQKLLVVDVRLSQDTSEVWWNVLFPIPGFHAAIHLSGLSFHVTSSAKPSLTLLQAWAEVFSQLFVHSSVTTYHSILSFICLRPGWERLEGRDCFDSSRLF